MRVWGGRSAKKPSSVALDVHVADAAGVPRPVGTLTLTTEDLDARGKFAIFRGPATRLRRRGPIYGLGGSRYTPDDDEYTPPKEYAFEIQKGSAVEPVNGGETVARPLPSPSATAEYRPMTDDMLFRWTFILVPSAAHEDIFDLPNFEPVAGEPE